MPATPITLTEVEREGLATLVRRHTTAQQIVMRARIVLAAAAGYTNVQIVQQIGVSRESVRLWRDRWATLRDIPLDELPVAQRLADAPRPGTPARITAEQVCQIVALACAAPATAGRPISQWSSREIADEIVTRGIVATISPRHAARLLKRGRSSRI
ncbi:MAG: helix-turn-helix domain-containing protein [Gemmatimonadota bacterium]|nr:helix-turn-helix domain-containing protein [Gemmatimonadota bacterium]